MTEEEAPYGDIAQLREALTVEDPDQRAPAYGAVMEAGFQPSEVLSNDPPEEDLAEAGVIGTAGGDSGRPAQEVREEQVELLRDIRDLLAANGGGS